MSQVTPQSDAADSPGWRWLPLNVGTALALAVIVSLLAFTLTSSGESPVAAANEADRLVDEPADEPVTLSEPANEDTVTPDDGASGGEEALVAAPPTTVVAAAETFARDGGGDAAFASSFSVLAMASDITNMGSTEIGLVTNFPSVDYSWERVEISGDGQFDVGWFGQLGDTLIAVSPTWDEAEGEGQRLVAHTSTDGLVWENAGTYGLDEDTWVSRIVSDGERIFAFAERWRHESGESQHYVLSSSDGIAWTESTVDLGGEPGEHVYIQNAAAGPAGVAVAASFESSPEEGPNLLDFGEIQVELNYMMGTYTLMDAESGEVLMSGSTDELFRGGGDGQAIYDPESGELLTTIPWDIWERAYSGFYEGGYGAGSPLPVPVHPEPSEDPPVITVEYDGFIVTVDEWQGEYSVTAADSGELIAADTLDYLYQGPPPLFVDPESGEELLSVTWEQWYEAEEQSYMHMDSRHFEYTSRTVLFTSQDGESWKSEAVPARSGAHASFLAATDDGFVAMINTYSEFGGQRSVWTMTDGEWSQSEVDQSDLWLYQVADDGDRLIGVGEGPGGPALWMSTDGVNWASEFAIVPQNDGSYVSLTAVAADESGAVGALAYREKWSDYRPLVIEQDGYTLTFEDGETVLSVTEDSSGEVVLEIGWESFEREGGLETITWEDGVTYIELDNGDVVAIADEDAYEAMESRWTDQGERGISVFLNDGTRWSEAIVDVEGGLNGATQLYMVDGKIFIAGSYWAEIESYRSDIPADSSFVVIVGTPIEG